MLKNGFKPRKGQLIALVALLVLVLGMMVMMMKCSHSAGQRVNPFSSGFTPAGGDTLNVAIELNPSVYRVNGDTIVGRDYAILQAISQEKGIPIKYHPFVPLDMALQALDSGIVDVVVTSRPSNSSIKDRYLMTDPVYIDRQILVQRADSASKVISSQVDLGGDTVWLPPHASFRSRLENLSAEIGDTIIIKSSPDYSAEALFILVATGKIKYAVINEDIARELLPEFDNVDISVPLSFSQFQSWALRKDATALCDSLNLWLKALPAKTIK